VPSSPRLRLDTVAGTHWSKRFEAMVAAGERHPRTYEAHRFHLDHDLLPRVGHRRIASLGVEDIAELITELRAAGRSAKTTANALATLQSVLRFARRRGWILADPVALLEPEERPHPPRRSRGKVLGQAEIERLLDACPPRGRILVETALFSGLRISELLGLIWEDVDFTASLIRIRAALPRPSRRTGTAGGGRRHPPRSARCRWPSSSHTFSPPTSGPHPSPRQATGSSPPNAAPLTGTATSRSGCCAVRPMPRS
jgi:integrase